MKLITPSQRRTLEVVAALTLLHERAPTLREIGRVLGVSREAVFYRLHWLEKKGLWSGCRRRITKIGLVSALDGLSR